MKNEEDINPLKNIEYEIKEYEMEYEIKFKLETLLKMVEKKKRLW